MSKRRLPNLKQLRTLQIATEEMDAEIRALGVEIKKERARMKRLEMDEAVLVALRSDAAQDPLHVDRVWGRR